MTEYTLTCKGIGESHRRKEIKKKGRFRRSPVQFHVLSLFLFLGASG